MKLVNLITGSTLSVEDTHGERLLSAGGWAKSTTAEAKKAISDTIARNGRTPTALTPAPAGDGDGEPAKAPAKKAPAKKAAAKKAPAKEAAKPADDKTDETGNDGTGGDGGSEDDDQDDDEAGDGNDDAGE